MDYYQQYQNQPAFDLLEILENAKDYNEECVKVIKQLVKERDISEAELKEMATQIHIEKAQEILMVFDSLNNELELPASEYLSSEEMKTLYREQFKWLKDRTEGFEIDSWSYAIGGM